MAKKKNKCSNHPDREAVAVYKDVLLCKKCFFDFILQIDKTIDKKSFFLKNPNFFKFR